MRLLYSQLKTVFFLSILYSFIITYPVYAKLAETLPTPILSEEENYYALLIGVSNYPSLKEEKQLKAPENDVRLLKTVLTKYSFAENNITTLSTANKDALKQPTRRVILAELEKLVEKAKANDTILLYFSGHGSQQPNANESDGYDELFLPSDIGQWDDKKGQVKNALVDNEIGHFIDRLLAKNASVWLIMDSCHSATGAREATTSNKNPVTRKARTVSLADLGVPAKKALFHSRSGKNVTENATKKESTAVNDFSPKKSSAHFTGLYASAAQEEAFEDEYPSLTDNNKKVFYGDFTYAIMASLQQEQAMNRFSYRDLQKMIKQKFRALGIFDQHPQYEGAKDLILFSNRFVERMDNWILRIKEQRTVGRYYISAGKVQGFAKDMLLDIMPTLRATQAMATVKITAIDNGESELCVVDQQGHCTTKGEAFTQLEIVINKDDIVFARLAKEEMIPTLKVYVSAKAQQKNERLIQEKLAILRQENPSSSRFIKWVDTADHAEVIINFPSELTKEYRDKATDQQIWLQVPQNSSKRFKETIPLNHAAKEETSENLFQRLLDKLYIINKTLRLKELAKEINEPQLEQHIALELFKKNSNEKQWQVLDPAQTSITLPPGNDIGFTLKNNFLVETNKYLDVGLFMLSPNYEIIAFPCYDADHENTLLRMTKSTRLAPQQHCIMNKEATGTEVPSLIRIKDNEKFTLGRYYFLIIATTKFIEDHTEDYAYLLQPAIGASRGQIRSSENNKIARYLNYFSSRGGNRTGREALQSRLPGNTKIFMRLLELNVQRENK